MPRYGQDIHVATRIWSLSNATYAPPPRAQGFCATPAALLESLARGWRVPLLPPGPAGSPPPNVEHQQSLFLPAANCTFRWYSPAEACAVMGRFSRVYLVGDSFVRHMQQGLFALLRGNFEYGALPLVRESALYDFCRCDGQFSEHVSCRLNLDFGDRCARQPVALLSGPR